MRAGQLDRRWRILERATNRNDFGENETGWVVIATVWGSWETLRGTEKWASQQFVERGVARVRMRYLANLTAEHRIESDELGQFEITGEPEQRRREGETVIHVTRAID